MRFEVRSCPWPNEKVIHGRNFDLPGIARLETSNFKLRTLNQHSNFKPRTSNLTYAHHKIHSILIHHVCPIYIFDNRWVIGGNAIPPLGKFLDPFHGFWQNIESSENPESITLEIPGVKDKVTVVFDSLDIPHIFANNDEDLYFAQGYVTAAHRLWQMEFQTHAAAGRVSEITGEGKNGVILNYDRSQRRLGMVYGAEKTLNLVNQDSFQK